MHQTRSIRRAVLVLGSTLGLLAACREPTAPAYDAMVTTAQPIFGVPTSTKLFRLDASVTNALDETITLDLAGRDLRRLEKWVSGAWRPAYYPAYTDQGRVPVPVAPGETGQLQTWVTALKAPNTIPTFKYDIPGTYRGVYRFERRGNFIEVYSNPFELRWAK